MTHVEQMRLQTALQALSGAPTPPDGFDSI